MDTHRWGHSTTAEAARIADQAGVAQLIMTPRDSPCHFDQQPLLDEARPYFDGPISVAGDPFQVTVGTQ